MDLYILTKNHHVRKARNSLEWARWFENHERRIVEQTELKFHWVSTVFLGIDHRWVGKGPPVVFETMTFTRERVVKKLLGRLMSLREEADVDFGFNRYCSWDDALTGHRAIVGRLQRIEAEAERATT